MRMNLFARSGMLAASLLSVSLFSIAQSSPATDQSKSPAAASCTTTVLTVNSNSTHQGDVFPAGVNASDAVVGLFQDLSVYAVHGYLWSSSTGGGTLYDYPGAAQTVLSAINDAGLVVGTYIDSRGNSHGFFLKNGQTTPLAVPGADDTSPAGINNNGVVVGTYDTFLGGPVTGFQMKGSAVTTIQFPGAVNTYPVAVNDAGAIVGLYYDGTADHGFMEYRGSYTKLEPEGASSSEARGINNSGEIVGEYRPSVNAEGEGFTYLNGTFTSYTSPASKYTEFDGVNLSGDRVGDAITGRINGYLAGPGFLLKCR
jgi:uncharacterized membrane protein